MFAVFGITPAHARKKVRVPLIDKKGQPRSLAEVEADRAAKIQRLLEKGRPVQLSEVYGVLACAHQFADLALQSGGYSWKCASALQTANASTSGKSAASRGMPGKHSQRLAVLSQNKIKVPLRRTAHADCI